MYQETPPLRFLLALAVVAVPLLLLERGGEERWAWRYAGLIILMMVVTHWPGLTRFAGFVRYALRS